VLFAHDDDIWERVSPQEVADAIKAQLAKKAEPSEEDQLLDELAIADTLADDRADDDSDATGPDISFETAPSSPPSHRAQLLNDAEGHARAFDANYGTPFSHGYAAAALKASFWSAFNAASAKLPKAPGNYLGSVSSSSKIESARPRDALAEHSPHGHMIDIILQSLAAIATSPDPLIHEKLYRRIAMYAALAYEVARQPS